MGRSNTHSAEMLCQIKSWIHVCALSRGSRLLQRGLQITHESTTHKKKKKGGGPHNRDRSPSVWSGGVFRTRMLPKLQLYYHVVQLKDMFAYIPGIFQEYAASARSCRQEIWIIFLFLILYRFSACARAPLRCVLCSTVVFKSHAWTSQKTCYYKHTYANTQRYKRYEAVGTRAAPRLQKHPRHLLEK